MCYSQQRTKESKNSIHTQEYAQHESTEGIEKYMMRLMQSMVAATNEFFLFNYLYMQVKQAAIGVLMCVCKLNKN